MSSFKKPEREREREREKERNAKKRESVIQIQEQKVGNRNCLWEGPDVRFNNDFKGAILNTFKKLKEIKRTEVKELCIMTMSHQLKNVNKEIEIIGTSLVVQRLRLHAPNAEGQGSIPGQETRSHTSRLRACMLQLKDTACRN